jgi:hypothetical protein
MTRLGTICCAIAFMFAVLPACSTAAAQASQETSVGSKMRVGTFDSRAVAIAYGRSEAFGRAVKSAKEEYEKAKSEGNEKRAKELDAEGSAGQDLMHKQGFSTYSVDNILEKIKEQIPGIAAQANVDVIVSKWDIIYQRPGIEFIDVTDLMVKPFDPNERTLGIIQDLLKQNPIPLEEMKNFKD